MRATDEGLPEPVPTPPLAERLTEAFTDSGWADLLVVQAIGVPHADPSDAEVRDRLRRAYARDLAAIALSALADA